MDIILLLLSIFLGIIAGIITGMIPGIHINLIAMMVLINFHILSQYLPVAYLIIFIISMGTTHSFIDFIPSVLFGVPSSDTALSVLPAHKLVLEGLAYRAIFLSSLGSLLGLIYALAISPLFYFTLEKTYEKIQAYIPFILLFALIALILLERKKERIIWASIIVLCSGSLGMLILNSVLTNNSLLILFTGLFGTAGIIISLKDTESKIPTQELELKFKFSKEHLKAIFVGGICSSVCSVSPGIGNSQAGTLAALFFRKIEAEIFILVISAINTINFIISFLTFIIIERARNGSVFVISQISSKPSLEMLIIYFSIITIVALISFYLTLKIGKKTIKILSKIDSRKINYAILIFLILLITFTDKIFGLIILICTTSIGILCVLKEVRRVHLMAVLLVPVILNLM